MTDMALVIRRKRIVSDETGVREEFVEETKHWPAQLVATFRRMYPDAFVSASEIVPDRRRAGQGARWRALRFARSFDSAAQRKTPQQPARAAASAPLDVGSMINEELSK